LDRFDSFVEIFPRVSQVYLMYIAFVWT